MTEQQELLDPANRNSNVNDSYRKDQSGNQSDTPKSNNKKKWIIGGVVGALVVVAVTIILIVVLSKDEDHPYIDPTVYYDPYEVEA
jgi:flagellar basal body-associated protein FliL